MKVWVAAALRRDSVQTHCERRIVQGCLIVSNRWGKKFFIRLVAVNRRAFQAHLHRKTKYYVVESHGYPRHRYTHTVGYGNSTAAVLKIFTQKILVRISLQISQYRNTRLYSQFLSSLAAVTKSVLEKL